MSKKNLLNDYYFLFFRGQIQKAGEAMRRQTDVEVFLSLLSPLPSSAHSAVELQWK